MNKPGLQFISLLVFLMVISMHRGYASGPEFQSDSIRGKLTAQDLKKLASAKEYEDKAAKTLQGCGEFSKMISSPAPDTSIHNDTYNAKCRRKRLAALDLYFSANDLRNQVYRSNIKEFLNKFSGNKDQLMKGRLLDEQSLEYLNRSSDLKKSAERKVNETDKLNLLEQALALETKGIETEKEAWDYFSHWPENQTGQNIQPVSAGINVQEKAKHLPSPVATTMTVIDTAMLNRLRDFPDSTLSNGPYAFRNSTVSLKSYNVDDLRNSWYTYLDTKPQAGPENQESSLLAQDEGKTSAGTGISMPGSEKVTPSTGGPDTAVQASHTSTGKKIVGKDNNQVVAERKNIQAPDSGKLITRKTAPSTHLQQDTSKMLYARFDQSGKSSTGKVTATTTNNNPVPVKTAEDNSGKVSEKENSGKITYRVQIAANPTLLTQGTLRKLYTGNKQVEVINENGWNKYSIGDFDSFEEADNFRNQCGVQGAFVVVYKGDKKVPFEKALAETMETSSPVAETTIETPARFFAVQIAASRESLPDNILRLLYSGNQPVTKHFEDNWYKYTIGRESTLLEAQRLKAASGVKGAFIVSYQNGVRIALSGLTPSSEEKQEDLQKSSAGKTFKVQIAASRRPLSDREIKSLYSGTGKVTMQLEDGWYRYTLGNETTYAGASDLKTSLNLKNTFIAIYSNGKRIYPASQGAEPAGIAIIPGVIPAGGQSYFVQLTASRSKIFASQLGFINEAAPVMEFYEDGWFKYRINCGNDLQKAHRIRGKYSDQGAFIVSFMNGKKTGNGPSSNFPEKTN